MTVVDRISGLKVNGSRILVSIQMHVVMRETFYSLNCLKCAVGATMPLSLFEISKAILSALRDDPVHKNG